MIRKIRGYDVTSFFGMPLSASLFSAPFAQGFIIAGATSGNAWWIISTQTWDMTDIFDQQKTWIFGSHFMLKTSTGNPWNGTTEWLQISNDVGPLISIRINSDRTISILAGSNNSAGASELRRTASPITQDTWYHLEFKVQFGANGNFEMRLNGGSVVAVPGDRHMDNTNINILPVTGQPLPDRILQHFHSPDATTYGFAVDNMFILDGQTSDGLNDFLGPCGVYTVLPAKDQLSTGWHPSTAGDLFPMVNDSAVNATCPDGDTTFIAPLSPSQNATWGLQPTACTGLIYAVAGNIVARPTSGSPFVGFIYQGTSSPTLITPERQTVNAGTSLGQSGPTIGYAAYQVISAKNPITMGPWTDGDINSGFWGVSSDNFTSNQRITQFYLEKLISLNTAVKFGCGGPGSYSYTN